MRTSGAAGAPLPCATAPIWLATSASLAPNGVTYAAIGGSRTDGRRSRQQERRPLFQKLADVAVHFGGLFVNHPMSAFGDALHREVRDELLQAVQIGGQQRGVLFAPDDQRGRFYFELRRVPREAALSCAAGRRRSDARSTIVVQATRQRAR